MTARVQQLVAAPLTGSQRKDVPMWERGQPIAVSLQVAKRRRSGLDTKVRWRVEFDAPVEVGASDMRVSMLDELDGSTYETTIETHGRWRKNLVMLAVRAICAARFDSSTVPAPRRPAYKWDRVDLSVTVYGISPSAIPFFRLSVDAKSRSSVAIYWDASVALGLTTRPRVQEDADPIAMVLRESITAGRAAPR